MNHELMIQYDPIKIEYNARCSCGTDFPNYRADEGEYTAWVSATVNRHADHVDEESAP